MHADSFSLLFALEQTINDKILSLNYEDYTAEIKTADAQESYEKGVIVLVTGCLTGKDNVKKKFTQTFFLAPQDKGFFVLNDVFRFVEENESLPSNSALVNGISENAPPAALTAESGWDDVVEPGWHDIPSSVLLSICYFYEYVYWEIGNVLILSLLLFLSSEPAQATDNLNVDPTASYEKEDLNDDAEDRDPSDKDDGSVIEEVVIEPSPDTTQNEIIKTVDAAPASLEDAPKQSYASIVSFCS